MQSFVGKVCSVVSTAMNRDFKENICREHFVIRVTEIDSEGIWGHHPYNDKMFSFFNMSHIISIHEEQEIDPSNPEHAAMLEEAQKTIGTKPQGDLKNSPDKKPKKNTLPIFDQDGEAYKTDQESMFVDIDMLAAIAQTSKSTFDKEDEFKADLFKKRS